MTRILRITSSDDPRYRRGHELRCLEPGEDLAADAVDPARFAALLAADRAVEVAEAPEAWTLATPPDAYLGRYPDGPKAELARAILAAGGGGEEDAAGDAAGEEE